MLGDTPARARSTALLILQASRRRVGAPFLLVAAGLLLLAAAYLHGPLAPPAETGTAGPGLAAQLELAGSLRARLENETVAALRREPAQRGANEYEKLAGEMAATLARIERLLGDPGASLRTRNEHLTETERLALRLAASGAAEEARRQIAAEEYRGQRQAFAGRLDAAQAAARAREAVVARPTQVTARLALALAGFLLVGIGSLLSVRSVRALHRAESELSEKARDLAAFGGHLKQLHRLSTNTAATPTLFKDYLRTGCDIFAADLGLLLEVVDGDWLVREVESRTGLPPPSLGSTLAGPGALPWGATLALHDLADADAATATTLRGLRLQSYLGSPVRLEERLWGALCFGSALPKPASALRASTVELVELMARAISVRLAEEARAAERERDRRTLVEAREAAQESSRLKSEFVANMSHELRTPLNAVIGASELILDTPLSDAQREHAEAIQSSAEILLDLIGDVLDLSKIEAGKLDLEEVDFDVAQVVESVAEMLAPRAHAKGVEMLCVIEAGVPASLRTDARRLRQVLTNLAANAVKFTDSGEVVVRAWRPALDTLRIEVADTGPGITPAEQARLFQPFAQGAASAAARAGGTGLGLAISKRLAERMGGELGMTSEPGAGSLFWVKLALPPGSGARAEPRVPALAGRRVLLVDDNASSRAILGEQLSRLGLAVEEAVGGPLALEALRQAERRGQPFEAAVVDLAMPGMTGLELARLLKAEAALRDVRLLLLCPAGAPVGPDEVRSAGYAAQLRKPVRGGPLREALLAVLAPDAVETEARRGAAEAAASAMPEGFRVLVADDDPLNRRVAQGLLTGLGCRVDLASDGREAVETALAARYDLIFMDCRMPSLDGFQATGEIRRREKTRVPIIALTAGVLRGERARGLEAGMDEFMTKPVRRAEFKAALARWAQLPAQRAPAPPAPERDSGPIDKDALARLRSLGGQDSRAILVELIDIALSDTPERLKALREAVALESASAIRDVAHTLKPRCAQLGATAMLRTCGRLEAAGAEGDLSGVRGLLDELERDFRRVREALESERARLA